MNDLAVQGDLSEQVALLKKWIDIADREKNPGLVDRLVGTLSSVVAAQDKRNVLQNNVLGRDAIIAFAEAYSRHVAAVLNDEIEDDETRWRIIDRIHDGLFTLPEPSNSEADRKRLLGRADR